MGIHDALKLSVFPIKYNCTMLLTSLMFWNIPTSSFHFQLGVFSPTLFDLAAIASIRPDGPLPDLCFIKEKYHNLTSIPAYALRNFLEKNMTTESEPISDPEDVAFLQY
jgi:hypothetical protein